MNIAVVNQSTVVPYASPMVGACAYQLSHHVAHAYERTAPHVKLFTDVSVVPAGWDIVAILDDADQAGALGYHDEINGRPYGRVFAKTVLDNGGTLNQGPLSVSAVLSHELAELFADAACSEWSDRGDGLEVALELADPVENDCYTVTYRGHDISVSDFVFPSYFDPQATGPYDYLNVLTRPFSIAKGGYLIVRKAGPESQKFNRTLEFGDDLPPAWLSPVKLHPAARTARRLTKET